MPQNRQQVGDLAPAERLQPVAAPTQNVIDPGSAGNILTDGLKALGQLSPTLDAMAQRHAENERVSQEAAVEGKIGGMTFDEFKAAKAQDPTLGFTGTWARAALDKQYGIRLGNEVHRQAEDEIATADFTAIDPEAYVAGKVKDAQAQLPPGSKWAASGFNAATAGLVDKVRDKVNGDRIERTVQTRNDNAAQNFQSAIDRAVEANTPPAEIVKMVRDQYGPNRDLLGIDYKSQDKIMAGVLETLAGKPGNEELIQALGTSLDRDGKITLATKLGAKFETLKTQAHAETLKADNESIQGDLMQYHLAAATGDPTKFDEKAFLEDFVPKHPSLKGPSAAAVVNVFRSAQEANHRAAVAEEDAGYHDRALIAATPHLIELARSGHIAEVAQDQELTKPSGNGTVTLTKAEMKEAGLRKAADAIEAEGQAQHLDPLAILGNRARMYGQNGEVDPVAQSRVSALLNATANPGDLPQTTMDYLPQLNVLMHSAPHMVDQIASGEKDRKFLQSLSTGIDYGLTPQEAMKNAVYRRDNSEKLAPMDGKSRAKMTGDVIKSLSGQGGFLFWGKDKVGNPAEMQRIVEDRLGYYYDTGASGKDLEKRVVDSVNRTHTYLNGHLIDVSGTGMAAAQAAPILQEAAQAVAEAKPNYGKLGITFIPIGQHATTFKAVTSDGTPVPGTERTWEEMQGLYGQRRTTRLQQRADQRAKDGPTPLALAGQAMGSAAAPVLKDAGHAYSTAGHLVMEGVRSLPKVEVTDSSASAASGLPGFRER